MNYRQFYYNHPEMKNRRRQLRKDSTESENILWQQIKNSALGVKIKRQYSVAGYVIDFFCPEKRVAIELEGKVHTRNDQVLYDNYRMKFLDSLDIEVLRIPSKLVFSDLDKVLELISSVVSSSHKVGEEEAPLVGAGGEV